MHLPKLSIILPAKNEAVNLSKLLDAVKSDYPDAELIVVNDGSTDDTAKIAEKYADIVVTHPTSMGNGAAVKAGARKASGEVFVFMDADGQHDPKYIPLLLETMSNGYAMTIGARSHRTQASLLRRIGNNIFNKLASLMTGHVIKDLTSGFRAVEATKFKQFLYLLPNGFSYPTTITMAFLRSGLPVCYIPIDAGQREGKSKIKPVRDGIRFLIIIFKIGALFSPMRLFLPISLSLGMTGICYYAYTYFSVGRFTNMSALLFLSSLFIFLIGILAEQISMLSYQNADRNQDRD